MVASFIWCLACITSIFLKILLLSLLIVVVNMSCRPVFLTYSILIRLSYIKVLLVVSCINEFWRAILFFCVVGTAWHGKVKKEQGKEYSREWCYSPGSAGTHSVVEGPSPPAKSTNTVSPAPPAAASASTIPASQPVTRSFAPELASSQAAFTPNTTSEALLTQQDLARSDEPHEHQHQDGTWPSQVAVACSFICTLIVWRTLTLSIFVVELAPRRKRKQTSGIMLDRITKSKGGRMEIHFEAGLKRPREATESTKLVSEAAVAVRCHARILLTWI